MPHVEALLNFQLKFQLIRGKIKQINTSHSRSVFVTLFSTQIKFIYLKSKLLILYSFTRGTIVYSREVYATIQIRCKTQVTQTKKQKMLSTITKL